MRFVEGFAFFFKFWASVFTSYIGWLPWLRPKRRCIIGEIVLVTGAGHGMGRLEAIEFSKLGATIVLPKDIRGEIVLVTGAGHGMGRLEALEFAKRGAIVIVSDINEETNEETADLIRETGGTVHAYTCDVSKRENIQKLAADIREDVGDVSILVNNAGVIYVADIMSYTNETIQRTFDVNIMAHFWLIREFLPAMKRKNHGHIVALASQAGLNGSAYFSDYCSSKHAVVGLCDSLRRELRSMKYDGVHVTYICPSFVSTGFVTNPSCRMSPIFTPEKVVDELMKAVLINAPCVTLPKIQRLVLFGKSILPTETMEVVFEYNNAHADRFDKKKER